MVMRRSNALDLNMPGLSCEMLSALFLANNKTKNATIIFYSSNDEDSLRAFVHKYGVSGYVCKGDIPNLLRKVAKYIKLKGKNG